MSPAFVEAFCPFGRVTSTVEPASAVPVIAVAPALTGFTVGAAGGVVSFTANTYFNNCPPLLSVTVLAPALYVSAFLELTSFSVYPLASNLLIAF